MSTRIRHQSIEIADLLGARVDQSGDAAHSEDAGGNSEPDVVATHDRGHCPSGGSGRSPSGGAMVAVRPEEIEVVVLEEWLADLHDPSLVIAPGYIGPDRRRAVRTTAPQQGGLPLWFRRVCLVAFLTALCVVPLTMIASRSVPPALTPAPTPQAAAADAATARQQARTVAAAQQMSVVDAERLATIASELGHNQLKHARRGQIAVQAISRKGTGTVLVLTNGLEVPVGRSYAGELRDAGWLNR